MAYIGDRAHPEPALYGPPHTPSAYARHLPPCRTARPACVRSAYSMYGPRPLQVYSRALAGAQAGWGKELSSMQGWGCALTGAHSSASLVAAVSAFWRARAQLCVAAAPAAVGTDLQPCQPCAHVQPVCIWLGGTWQLASSLFLQLCIYVIVPIQSACSSHLASMHTCMHA